MITIAQKIANIKVMIKRNLYKSLKNPDRIMENIIAPVMTMLIFVFILGGVMNTATDVDYVNYMIPGVFILCIGQCSSASAIAISSDIKKGIVDRFRSMPIAKFSFLVGHVVESMIRSMASLGIVFLISLLVGFRPTFSFGSLIIALAILLLFTIMITWIAIAYGLFVKGPEGAGSLTMFIMLFAYLSSGFIPTQTLPTMLRAFAEHQPFTPIIEVIRRLLLAQPLENFLMLAVIWCIVISLIAYFVATHLYKVKTNH